LKQAAECYRRAADQEDEAGQYLLGECYLCGQGVSVDLKIAAGLFQKSASKGYVRAAVKYGELLRAGRGVPVDLTLAVSFFKQASEKGDKEGMMVYAECLANGIGTDRNLQAAIEIYKVLAADGDLEAQFALGNCLAALGDLTEAAKCYEKAGQGGIAAARVKYGDCLYYGRGVARDVQMAALWYKQAADQADRDGQYAFGRCVSEKGVPGLGDDIAVEYLQLAAKQKHVQACIQLADHLQQGIGTPVNDKQAVHYLKVAAESGDRTALYRLGLCLADGFGHSVKPNQAATFFRKAADQGLAEAQIRYGDCLRLGIGVSLNPKGAAEYYRRAAAQGDAAGAFNFGNCLRFGFGIQMDFSQAAIWFKKALDDGYADAIVGYRHCIELEGQSELAADMPDLLVDFSTFRFVRTLGQGSFGIVKLMEEKSTRTLYAVKEFPNRSAYNEGMSLSFTREVKLLATLKHPCILPIRGFAVATVNSHAKIATDFMPNGSLEDVLEKIRKNKRPPEFWSHDCIAIVIMGISLGMRFMHAKEIIHRDLKPANLLLDRIGRVRIGDLGTARMQVTDARMTMQIGTPFYMAPEVGQDSNYTSKIDVYSFGLILYELMTGQPVFEEKTPIATVILKTVTGVRPTIPETIPQEMKELIEACWMVDPDTRPSFATIVEGLKKFRFKFFADVNSAIVSNYVAEVEAGESSS
jgi:TPR repeat protein